MRKKAPYITTALIIINIVIFFLAEIFSGSTENTQVLIRWGGAYVPYIAQGEYWRLFTAMFMHAGMRHLLNNMLILYVMGQHLEFLLGRICFAVLYLAGGLSANYAAYLWYRSRGEATVAVGASGAVFAVIGALIWIILRNRGRADGLTLRQMLIMLVLSLYFGFVSRGVSNAAHIAGLISGFVLAVLLYRKRLMRSNHSF